MDDRPPKTQRKIWLPVALLVVLAGGAALAFVLSLSPRRNQVAILPDGSRVEVLGAVSGTNVLTTEKSWQHFARKILPARFQNRIPTALTFRGGPPVRVGSIVGARVWSPAEISNSVAVFFNFQPGPANVRGPGGAIQLYYHVEVADDGGLLARETDLSTAPPLILGPPSTNRPAGVFFGVLLQAIPRRDADFELHLLSQINEPLATFRVRTPPHPPFPVWKPQPLPQSLTNGSFALTLQRLEHGGTSQKPQINCVWDFQSTPPGWTNAHVDAITFSDATGNVGTNLSLREPAWKIHGQVRHEWVSSNPPPEKLVISNLAIQGASNFTAINRAADFGDVRVMVKLIAGTGSIIYHKDTFAGGPPLLPHIDYQGGWSVSSRQPYLLVDVNHGYGDGDVAFRLTDQSGREIEMEKRPDSSAESRLPTGYGSGSRIYYYSQKPGPRPTSRIDRLYQLYFSPDTNVTSLTLEAISLRRADDVEFIINPKDVQTTVH